MMTPKLLTALAITTLCLSPLRAFVVSSISTSAPTENIVFSQPDYTSGLGWFNTDTSRRDVGQSFLATSNFTLEAITYTMGGFFSSTTSTSDYTINIYSTSSLEAAPNTGTLVSSQSGTFTFEDQDGGNDTFLTFDIEDVSLSSGKYYTIMLVLDDNIAGNSITLKQSSGSVYADGYRWLYNGTDYSSSTTSDMTLYLTGSTIPEPSGAMIFPAIGGLLAVLIWKRKQRA